MTEKLLNEILIEIKDIKSTMATKKDVEIIFSEQQKDILSMLHIVKDQLTEQNKSTENRLDRIAMDINFLVRKAAEHENDILSIKKAK
jgi:glycerol-3-phosphate cytidylyltransferase-like family protein